jgi:ribosomal protein S18 acetylase RimI-like enzyme
MQSEPGFWKQDTRLDVLDIALASAKDLAFVWDEDGRILGFVCAHDLGFRAYLSELIVHESTRRRGIGKQLVQHVEDELMHRKCPVLVSDVWRNAEAFYRSLGWSEPDVTLLRKKLDAEDSQAPAEGDAVPRVP